MSYTILNELTVVEQIEKTGRASVTIDVDGCYGGLGGGIRVEVAREYYVDDKFVFEFNVHTNFAPKPETDIVVALENFTEAMSVVTETVAYYKENMSLLTEAFEVFKGSIEAERVEAEERFKNDTSMFYTAEKAVNELASTARNGSGAYEMRIRRRGETDYTIDIVASKGRDGKIRFEQYGYKTSKKAVIRDIQERGAEVVSIERY